MKVVILCHQTVTTRAINCALRMIKRSEGGIFFEHVGFSKEAKKNPPSVKEVNSSTYFDKLDKFDNWIIVQEMRGSGSRNAHVKCEQEDYLSNLLIAEGNKPALEADEVYIYTQSNPGLTLIRINNQIVSHNTEK